MGSPINLWTAMIKPEILSGKHCWKTNRSLCVLLERNLVLHLEHVHGKFILTCSFASCALQLKCASRWQSYFLSLFAFLGKTSLFHLFSTYKMDCHSPAERHCTISSRTVLLSSTGWSAWLEVCEYLCLSTRAKLS